MLEFLNIREQFVTVMKNGFNIGEIKRNSGVNLVIYLEFTPFDFMDLVWPPVDGLTCVMDLKCKYLLAKMCCAGC